MPTKSKMRSLKKLKMNKNEIKYFCDELAKKQQEIDYAVQFMGNIMAMLRDSKYKPAILAQVNPDCEVYQICDFLWAEIEKWHEKHGEDGQQQSDRDTERL